MTLKLYCWNIVISNNKNDYRARQRQIYIASNCETKARCVALASALRECTSMGLTGEHKDTWCDAHKRDLYAGPCVYTANQPVIRGWSLI